MHVRTLPHACLERCSLAPKVFVLTFAGQLQANFSRHMHRRAL